MKRTTITKADRDRASSEEAARQRGESIPFYARQVGRALARPKKASTSTPSKRG